jgi:D-sedoheptulose 7-phosphate isomerase/D-glycero-D-manno-heptose 1,7-bisphosphate phosphatase
MTQSFNGLSDYAKKLAEAMETLDYKQIKYFAGCVSLTTLYKGSLFVCGNGGSAAIANHFSCDYMKGITENTKKNIMPVKAISLSSNIPLITAVANDIGYTDVFSYQYKQLSDNGHDRLVVVSSSGNSPNIVKVVSEALKQEKQVFGIVGFDGGEVMKMIPETTIHIKSDNYGIIEDCSQAIMHMVAQQIIIWNHQES